MSKQLGRQQRPRGGVRREAVIQRRGVVDGLAHSCSPLAFHRHEVGLCPSRARQPSHIIHERAVVVRPRFCSWRLRLGRGPVRLRVASRAADLLADLAS
jgi:hypothetical protein